MVWVEVQGYGDEELLRRIGAAFAMHPLALEDVVNAPQRPKAEAYDEHLLLIARMARVGEGLELEIQQLAILVGADYVVSFQERYGDELEPIRRRLREGIGPMRSAGAGYLGYALFDAVVDAYYPVLEVLSDKLEHLEERVLAHPTPRTLDRLNRIKADLILLRRGAWPQLETVNRLLRDESRFLGQDARVYLRDTADHCAQIVDVIDSHRERVNGLMNTYLSVVSNRTNEVMKVLTIMASIFIPLTFLAGIYGMNFEFMPELHRPWAYPLLLLVMAGTAGGMLLFFRRRGWLGGGDDDDD
jgi:magnesium transporter